MEWPLPLWQVLREELAELRPSLVVPDKDKRSLGDHADECLFATNDIADDGALLARQIVRHAAELCELCTDGNFKTNIRKLKPTELGEELPEAELKQAEVDVLNRLLEMPNLCKAFSTIPESRYVAEQNPAQMELDQVKELNRELLDRVFAGGLRPVADKILPGVIGQLHSTKLSALCFSGGGIRSATFCLGVLQALARKRRRDDDEIEPRLGKFDYLSTVSGGGFLGGWLAAWTYWSDDGLPGVIRHLTEPKPSKLEPEPDPVFYLRNFSNYLTPITGLFSADTWTVFTTYLRNLLLTWIVLIPLLIALLAVPHLILALMRYPMPEIAASWGVDARWPWLALAVLGFAWAMLYQGMTRPGHLDRLREKSGNPGWVHWFLRHRRQGDFLAVALAPLMLSAFILATYVLQVYLANPASDHPLCVFLIFGAVAAFLGWIVCALSLRKWYGWDLAAMLLSALLGMGLFYLIVMWPQFTTYVANDPGLYLCIAPPMVLIVFLLAATFFVGLATFWTDDEDREYWSRMGAWILTAGFGWSAFVAISLLGPDALSDINRRLGNRMLAYGGSLVVSAVTTYLGFSSKTPATVDSGTSPAASGSLQLALPILGTVSIVLILVIIARLTTDLVHPIETAIKFAGPDTAPILAALFVTVGAASLGWIMSMFIDPNKYSLHAMYRNRLIRAYLGASRKKGERSPNPFTGFDPDDNIPMASLWFKEPQPRKLMPFINVSLNMVEPVSTKLAWQERKAESFTVTPLHAGSLWVGYRRAWRYAHWNSFFGRAQKATATPITLGTATAISGAAVSPDMGYNSSPIVSLLLTLFNARLGWWLGNPGPAGNDTYMFANPGKGARYLIDEALGRTNDQKPHVYLSDGGHFENLGLYEMVLRRCHTIVVVDADQDQKFTFENLGNAIRKVRTDLGIRIDFDPFSNFKKRNQGSPPGGPTLYCAVGTIHYRPEDKCACDGRLIYIKPTIRGDESADVLNYESQHPDFPHESTADQWFSESQFESYRALGQWEIEQILATPRAGEPDPYFEARDILLNL